MDIFGNISGWTRDSCSRVADIRGLRRVHPFQGCVWLIRKAISTSNAIESVNSMIRKLTRNRKIYPNKDSALKLIYLAIQDASKKLTMPIHRLKTAQSHFAVLFENRLPTT